MFYILYVFSFLVCIYVASSTASVIKAGFKGPGMGTFPLIYKPNHPRLSTKTLLMARREIPLSII